MATGLRIVDHLKRLSAMITLALVAACGGGGSDPPCVDNPLRDPRLPGCQGTVTPVPNAASVQLFASGQQLPSDGTSTVKLTVLAVDGNRQAVANRPVEFVVVDPENTAYVSNFAQPSAGGSGLRATDANGQLTATLSAGGSKANRSVHVSVTVDGAGASHTIDVTGTTIGVQGTNTVALGSTASFSLTLTDALGRPIAGIPVALASTAGNPVAPSSVTTDGLGAATFTYTGSRTGNDSITAAALGARTAYLLTVSAQNFAFTGGTNGVAQVPVGTSAAYAVRWTNNGVPVVGQPVNFASTRGTVSASQVTTDASGTARITVSSAAPGPATITASAAGASALAVMNVLFVANNVPARIDLQADRTTVATNPAGTGANVANLVATVRDATDYPVAGVTVNFRLDQDVTGGAIAVAAAVTDVYGVARSQYVPSALSSPTNGVVVRASVLGRTGAIAAVSNPLLLTVGGQRLFVRIGTDRFLEKQDANYVKKYSAFVTDAAGNPVPNATVQFLFRPAQEVPFDPAHWTVDQYFTRDQTGLFSPPGALPIYDYAYFKGYWSGTGQIVTAGCFNEDWDFSGIISPAKDYNGNGKLDPGNVFSVNQSAATNASGYATGTITYPQAWALWIRVTLTVTAQVAGTEARDSVTFIPTFVEGDNVPGVIDQTGSLPIALGVRSPFGVSVYCRERL